MNVCVGSRSGHAVTPSRRSAVAEVGGPFVSTANRTRRFVAAALVASVVGAGCDHPFQPFQENEDAVFSMFGYLDLNADTQWVRVMPVRQDLFLDPEPIDAVVTLEDLDGGHSVILNDSLFRFEDPQLDGLAYAYNFWTSERLRPGARYRLIATRSDGASSTAHVDLPEDTEISIVVYRADPEGAGFALLEVRAERILFVEMVYSMMSLASGGPGGSLSIDEHWMFTTDVPGTHGIGIVGDTVQRAGLLDVRRLQIHLTVGLSDWPFHPELSDLAVALPGTMPSNVENGLGFVGGVAISKIPFDYCEVLAPRPDREDACTIRSTTQSAAVEGRAIRAPCGEPHALANVRLRQSFADGGAVLRTWKTGWDGRYRFEGVEPATDLALEVAPGNNAVDLPRLAPGERYAAGDIAVRVAC